MLVRCWLSAAAAAATAAAASAPAADPGAAVLQDFGPSLDMARRRGPDIFNAVHDAMRQWGSSLHHNGMSFYLATVPKGVLLHHGNSSPRSPSEPDWLAFEIEHAENFARGRWHGPRPSPPGGDDGDDDGKLQKVVGDRPGRADRESEDEDEVRGYLHVYQTTRPLPFLYIDGMGGGKTSMGTLDSQDYLLRGKTPGNDTEDDMPRGPPPSAQDDKDDDKDGKPRGPRMGGPMDEQARARELCEWAKELGLQGVIRMEAGFEIIKCDFSDGLKEIQALPRPEYKEGGHPRGPGGMGNVEFIRGIAERYEGIGASRVNIDYSSMVSAFFFPVNLTNPNAKRPDLPRLASTEPAQLAAIKSYTEDVVREHLDRPARTVDWQDISDLIVGRYADRIQYMAEEVTDIETMADQVNFLLTLFVDGTLEKSQQKTKQHQSEHWELKREVRSEDDDEEVLGAAIDRCAAFYLHTVEPATAADRLIHAAFGAVTRDICATLFRVRALVATAAAPDQAALAAAGSALRGLSRALGWARFKRCPACDRLGEVCVIPMWPFGTVDMYNHPQCMNASSMDDGSDRYWGGGPGGPGRGRRPGGGKGGPGMSPPPPPLF